MKLSKINLDKFNKDIELSNDKFKNASKAEKRVMLAKDAIARIKMKQFEASTGTLADISLESYGDDGYKESFKTLIESNRVTSCAVCAKGGMLLSYVARFNNLTAEDAGQVDMEDGVIERTLKEAFTKRQLDLMEVAFEGTTFKWTGELSDSAIEKAEKFYRETGGFEDMSDWNVERALSERRLLAIYQNIVDNKGNFKL